MITCEGMHNKGKTKGKNSYFVGNAALFILNDYFEIEYAGSLVASTVARINIFCVCVWGDRVDVCGVFIGTLFTEEFLNSY